MESSLIQPKVKESKYLKYPYIITSQYILFDSFFLNVDSNINILHRFLFVTKL